MKFRLMITMLAVSIQALCQDFIVDSRDSSIYEVFHIENQSWFKTNLAYKSPTSWCNERPDSEACKSGNFYYATDLVNVCPSGWRVPTWFDYKKALRAIRAHDQPDSVSFEESLMPYKKHKIIAEHIIGITLIGDTTFFDMAANGWIEGDKWIQQQETTMWIIEDIANSPQPHVHIHDNQIIKHAHEHHVWDKPKRIRRFSVRCISNVK